MPAGCLPACEAYARLCSAPYLKLKVEGKAVVQPPCLAAPPSCILMGPVCSHNPSKEKLPSLKGNAALVTDRNIDFTSLATSIGQSLYSCRQLSHALSASDFEVWGNANRGLCCRYVSNQHRLRPAAVHLSQAGVLFRACSNGLQLQQVSIYGPQNHPCGWQECPYRPGRIMLLETLVQHVYVSSSLSLSKLQVNIVARRQCGKSTSWAPLSTPQVTLLEHCRGRWRSWYRSPGSTSL